MLSAVGKNFRLLVEWFKSYKILNSEMVGLGRVGRVVQVDKIIKFGENLLSLPACTRMS